MRTAARASVLLAALVLLAGGSVAGQETEEILSYDVRVLLQAGGAMEVTETIRVRALGNRIRRGIFRDFPTSFPREGRPGRIVAPFDVIEVRRDGNPEPYALEDVSGGLGREGRRVRIGSADVFLDPGVYTYEIVYETDRWVRFGEERDELTWNVTGNGWDFAIRSASAEVVLPERPPSGSVELEAWTGPEGSVAQDADWTWDAEDRAARFETTETLGPREGLTVRVSFPSGVVPPPTDAQRRAWFWSDYGGFVDAGVVVALVLGLYLAMWVQVGRDPPGRPIAVAYEPPQGFSAAELGYLRERGWSTAQLTAALVGLAVKGAVTLEKSGSTWTIRATDTARNDGLPAGVGKDEKKLYEEIVGGSRTLTLSGSSNSRLRAGVRTLRAHLAAKLEKVYFRNNRLWFAAGAVLSFAGMGWLAFRAQGAESLVYLFLGFWLTGWTAGTGTLVWRVVQQARSAFAGDVTAGLGAVVLGFFSIPFVAAELFVIGILVAMAPLHFTLAGIVVGGINVLFYHLLERPTLEGRRVMDRLEGFRRFLGATEEDRFDRMQAPDASLELFERYLPHAIALDVQNEWAERFEGALATASASAAAGTAAASSGALAWYSDSAGGSGGLSSLSLSLGSSFSSSLSTASAAPSSSGGGGSSSGGGGFSGGGGGGGGGGGW